ncbi:MAG: TraR/DksA family transcriptional regulator [Gammaproteobacteria bacterium]|nr:TraR/DksA family transcriptional regulator [Gammaproteobacteria bacterium]
MLEIDIPALRRKLLDLQEELQGLTRTADDSSQVVELDQARVGRLSRMDAMQAQAMSQAAGRRRELMLRNIAATLARMDEDDYGFCRSCDEVINPKRLEYDPTATMCVVCAGRNE